MRSNPASGCLRTTATLVRKKKKCQNTADTIRCVCVGAGCADFFFLTFLVFLLPVILQVGSGMSVSGGGLPDVYHTIQLHFHWGGPATNGSEHTVDRRRYPMEVQYGQ